MLSFPSPQRFEALRPDVRAHRQACRQLWSWPTHDLIREERTDRTSVLVTHAEDTSPYWIRLIAYPPEDRPVVRALLHALSRAVRSHALILLPRHYDLIIEQAEETIAEFVADAGQTLNPQTAYGVACEAGYGGTNPEYLRAAAAQDRAAPTLDTLTALKPRYRRLAHFIRLLDQYAAVTHPRDRATDEPLLGYSGWTPPLGVLDPSTTTDEYEWYYEPVNESYQQWMAVGDEALLPCATYPKTSLNRRALVAWTWRHARIVRHAVTVLKALDALGTCPTPEGATC